MQATASLQTDWAKTSLGWQERNLKIINKKSQLVPLRHNAAQLILYNARQLQRERGYPVRIIIVKARQKGLSTGEAADTFEDINRNSNRHACLISMDTDGTDKVFRMTKVFQQEMPADKKRPTEHSNRKEIIYSRPHRSSILCQTAGKDVLGRGGTTERIHATEVAFWRNAEKQLSTVFQEVPKTADTSIVLESTGCGRTGAFYNRYLTAVKQSSNKDYNGFIPIFVPWFVDNEYSMPLPEGYRLELYADHEYYGDEVLLSRKFNLTKEQIYWRRWIIVNDFDKDLTWFLQEYPCTWREAFQGTGRNFFLQSVLVNWEKLCARGRTVLLSSRNEPVDVAQRKNCWRVWKLPREGEYVLGVDTQEGKQSDPDDPKSDYDWHAAVMFSRDSGEIVAIYHGQGDQHELGEQCLRAARFYNNAWIAPEVPNGMVVLDVLKQNNYENIYRTQRHDYQQATEDTPDMGWRTTQITRPKMLEDLKQAVNKNEIRTYSIDLVDEMREFQRDKNGEPCHPAGGHDDLIFGTAIALQLHKRLPYKPKPYEYAQTVDIVEDKSKPLNELARARVVDTWEPGGGEDDDEGFLYTE